MEDYEAKSYFLACKMQRNVFIKSVLIETRAHDTYSSILETTSLKDHPFENIFVNIVTKLFNVMCNNLAPEVNSAFHKGNKRNKETDLSPQSIKNKKIAVRKMIMKCVCGNSWISNFQNFPNILRSEWQKFENLLKIQNCLINTLSTSPQHSQKL